MKTQKLEWEIVPTGWAVCFNERCTKRDECLRYQAGLLAPETLHAACCVMPAAWSGNVCKLFAPMTTERYAYGFASLYDMVKKKDYTPLRKLLTMKLQNKGYYYRYLRGELPLSPAQQQIVKEAFAQYGYTDNIRFDNTEYRYVFPWNNNQHSAK